MQEQRDNNINQLLLTLLRDHGYQAVNQTHAQATKAKSNSFWDSEGKGWGNWVCALGIAVSCITPLSSIAGFPVWLIGLALATGILFWRETNFNPLRSKFAEDLGFRDRKKHRFLENLSQLLKSKDINIEGDPQHAWKSVSAFIQEEEKYHTDKASALNHDETKKNRHKGKDTEYYIELIVGQLNTLLEPYDANINKEALEQRIQTTTDQTEADSHNPLHGNLKTNADTNEAVNVPVLSTRSDKRQRSLELNQKYGTHIRFIKSIVGAFGQLAAYGGNGIGCFVSGMTFAGFIASTLGVTTIPLSLTIATGIIFAVGGVVAYQSNTVPAIKKVAKDALYSSLDTGTAKKNAPLSYHILKALCILIAVSSSLIMGSAIGFFNYSFGIFLIGTIINPALLTSSSALVMLSGPTTTAGIILGATSGILVAIGTTCLFLSYITSGMLAKLDNWYNSEPSQPVAQSGAEKSLPVHIFHNALQALSILALVAVAVYSVNFFVLLPLPASLQTIASIGVFTAGTIVYTFQALSVTSAGLKNYGKYLGHAEGQKIEECTNGLRAVELQDSQINTLKQVSEKGKDTSLIQSANPKV